MNLFTILSGIAVLGISGFVGYIGVQLFMQGGTTPIFGGIAMSVIAIMSLVLGIVLIGMGWMGVVARIRSGKA